MSGRLGWQLNCRPNKAAFAACLPSSRPLKKCGCHVPRLPWACEFPRNHAHGKRGHGTLSRSPVFFNGLLVARPQGGERESRRSAGRSTAKITESDAPTGPLHSDRLSGLIQQEKPVPLGPTFVCREDVA